MKKAFKQSQVVKALNIGTIILILLTLASVICSSAYNTRQMRAAEARFGLTSNANLLKNTSAFLTNEVRAYAFTGDQAHYDNYWDEVNTAKNREKALENMYALGVTQEEKDIIDTILWTSNGLIPLEKAAMDYVALGRLQKAQEILYGQIYSEGVEKVGADTQRFLDLLDARTAAAQNREAARVAAMLYISLSCAGLVALVQVVSIAYSKRRIIRPVIAIEKELSAMATGNLSGAFALAPDTSEIGRLIASIHNIKAFLGASIGDISQALERMADNRYDFTLEVDYVGEFSAIKESFRRIAASMNETLREVRRCSRQVTLGARDVSEGAAGLAGGATAQAASVQEISNTVNHLSARLKETAHNAEKACEVALNAGGELAQGNEKMQHMLQAMEGITKASGRIGGIMKTIDDISFQTNILALNAAVEAARAGEAGKGFAVVADEVRNLASKSSTAAGETNALISSSIQAVEAGKHAAKEAAKTLDSVMGGAQDATARMQEIMRTLEEESAKINRLDEAVSQISQVVQTNSATAEESAAASQELQAMAHNLEEILDKFQLRESEADPA